MLVPFMAVRASLPLTPVASGAGTVVIRVRVRVMRVERVLVKDVVVVMAGGVVAGGSDWIVTVTVLGGSRGESAGGEVSSAGGAGERTGPMGPTGLGKFLLVGIAGLSRYPANTFSISARRCSRDEMMARRSSGRSLRPDWIFTMSSSTASLAVNEGEGASRVELGICCGSSFATIADEVVSDRGACLCSGLRWVCRAMVAEAKRE